LIASTKLANIITSILGAKHFCLKIPCGHGVDKMTKNDSVLMTQAKNKKQVKLLIT